MVSLKQRTASHFFAYVSRLRWIKRWGLMRNAIEENVATHSWEVATIAHALALIRNRHFNGQVNADRIAAAALYHDAIEVITGDMPTPVKYHSKVMREAFADIEHKAEGELLALLPDDLRADFDPYVRESQWRQEEKELIKAADRLSALLKCRAEMQTGNKEFEPAAEQILHRLQEQSLPEVLYFLEVFAPSYERPLDHLLG
ncbi:5'-deoxynucleotidase [Marinobacter halophilus]|uniref:5'-deoxynucleotidase n=1 Tax=Marinobacter halophilus TaxID=1323740 RepID=A0A2T1KJB9_9GAMM|nr:5'-deoxynucleotidase [Marinobacter halophilus]PSF10108.1 5'-deoxynucleotidase [Marinobacter halophilus]GGC67838.1 5'-deoxynucleotidase [Marinobacter halophilus]